MNTPHTHIPEDTRQAARRIGISLALTLAFVVFEFGAGLRANSLALLSDAGHNLTDVIALGLSWVALRLSLRPADAARTFGYHRAGILAALFNSASLVIIACLIFFEAYKRLLAPPEVQSGLLIAVGALAFGINLVTAWLVHQGSQHDLNLRSAFVHLMGDVLSTIGAVLAGAAILFSGWNWLDPLASMLIGALILWNAVGILRETIDILLESSPRDIDMDRMVGDLLGVEGVLGVHDLHVWSINQGLRAFSAHILVGDISTGGADQIREAILELVQRRYQIGHATVQLERTCAAPGGLYCDITQRQAE